MSAAFRHPIPSASQSQSPAPPRPPTSSVTTGVPGRLCQGFVSECGVLAATLVAAAGLCRMASGGIGGGAIVPLLAAAAVGFAVPALLLRTRLGTSLAALAGTVAVMVAAVWAAALRTSARWYPTASALRALPGEVRDARTQLAMFHLPLHAGPGLILLGAVAAGIAGLAARLLWAPFRKRYVQPHPAIALLPASALVTWSCIAVPGTGAAVLGTALVAAAMFVFAGRAGPRSRQHRTDEGTSTALGPRRGGAIFFVAALAVACALGIGIPFGSPGGADTTSRSGKVPVTALSLTTGLVRVERDDSHVILLKVHSPVPTYWQVAFLSVWRDDRWVTGAGTKAVLHGGTSPRPMAPTTAYARAFAASVTIRALSSQLLPVPTSTVTVTGPPGGTLTTVGMVSPSPSTPGETYKATALDITLARASRSPFTGGSQGTSMAEGLTTAELAPYVALPSIPRRVALLARQVTDTATSPIARAEDLVNWFRSGRFRYTLEPPAAPTGINPLVAFLTISRAGSCESFSGAFAVMARSLGLPTRVAVGFTDGRPASDGSSSLVGADAHAWPEVYLGAALGWVSFEPTPQQPSGGIAPEDVIGPTAPQIHPIPPPATPTSTPSPTTSLPASTTSLPASSVPVPTVSAPAHRKITPGVGHVRLTWLPVVIVLALLLFAMATGLGARRRRLRRRLAAPPDRRVIAGYRRTERSLRKAGIGRPPTQTPAAHARSLLDSANRSAPAGSNPVREELLAALRDLCDLTAMVEQAGYSPHPLTPPQAAAAELAAARVRRALRRTSVRSLARSLSTSDVTLPGLVRTPMSFGSPSPADGSAAEPR